MRTQNVLVISAIVIVVTGLTGSRDSLANLSGIGKAMLIYANDYEDELPRAGGRNAGSWYPDDLVQTGPLQWPHTPPDPTVAPERINGITVTIVTEVAETTPADATVEVAVCPPGWSRYDDANWVFLGAVPLDSPAVGAEIVTTFAMLGGDAPEWPSDAGWELWSQDNPFWVRAGGSGLKMVESIVIVFYTPTAEEMVEYTIEELEEIAEAHSGPTVTNVVKDLLPDLFTVHYKLTGPLFDKMVALENLEEAVGGLEELASGGLSDAEEAAVYLAIDLLTAVAQQTATNAIYATRAGADLEKMAEAEGYLAEANALWIAGACKDAVDKYADAVDKVIDAMEPLIDSD
ncbi:MAG: hypothetical protein JSW27_00550 [Phycisphaerales bacterium]|nr:MAG: hypothetical protein JSW27_00550 [Phycisphaerales bacterium]